MDYETLKLVWWLLVGALLVGFAIMDGHDMGVGTLLPFVAKTDLERRVLLNTVAPHWEGNQVWFVTAGGAIFAAWPLVYATAFSGFYWAMMAALWALFFRPVGFTYRSKVHNPTWRSAWDWGLFIGGAVPPVIFGVAFGNLLLGVPFSFNDYLMSTYTGSFWDLLNPFSLLVGVVSLAMITTQGANYLMMRTEGDIYRRVRNASALASVVTLAGFAAAGVWVATAIPGYLITSAIDANALPDPLAKTVVVQAGAWMANYERWPLTIAVPALAFAGLLASLLFSRMKQAGLAFWSSSVASAGIIGTAGVSLFPFIMPSSTDPRSSLTVYDAVSSHFTLGLMLAATVIFLPLIVVYTSWCYKVMWGKVTTEFVAANDKSVY
ncbi:MAG: cytochrome d ubiquinol oxidase subunit II [Hydrogenophilales bacterium 16-64-46]|nr:MAG: cytochrome d ubiquinol oxidase subunit II [Hydrogenophilales bacterium 12-64-13]OYZ04037.1 MAG: cytochrome d ubiquinol oxidase subunit II [Hydrogenophilales bacterium 16-64-46]OZA36675.1 MAG: cytochrome d ubiquinol oxidase subunit II [Hydrogenophilales bacterium 17-64-34]HQT01127.1 cytochrome d ubiquinol oxidase subunit II [Thiobacillus sp.]